MKDNVNAQEKTIKETPIEIPTRIGTVERYSSPLRVAYNRIRSDADRKNTDADCICMVVFAVNYTMGKEGLCPILLACVTIPRLDRNRKIPSAT